ncbi:MAG: hypothetical protein AB7T49_12275 [Oligoflexales bacterium]
MSRNPRNRHRHRRRNNRPQQENRAPAPQAPPKLRNYAVLFYHNVDEAKRDLATIEAKAQAVDQLNIVVQNENFGEHPDINKFGKLYAGAAWTLIHKRRVDDGWYEKQQL